MVAFSKSKDDVLNTSLDNRDGKLNWSTQAQGYFKFPYYSTAERDAMLNVETGLVIYNVTTNKINVYTGSAWEAVTSA